MSDHPDDDVNPSRRADYEAAILVILPQIEGETSIYNDEDLSAESLDGIIFVLNARSRRKDLLEAAIQQLNACNDAHRALVEDGYPDLLKRVVSDDVLHELIARRDAVNAAIEQFEPSTSLTAIINLGDPADKPRE